MAVVKRFRSIDTLDEMNKPPFSGIVRSVAIQHSLLAVACLGLFGMSVPGWRCAPSDELAHLLFQHEVPKAQYCAVNDAHLKLSVEELKDHVIVELSKRVADGYASPCIFESNSFIYLIRALDVSGNGQFTVYGHHGNLYVTSGVLGTSASPRRTALVLSTKFAVCKVYVNYFVAK